MNMKLRHESQEESPIPQKLKERRKLSWAESDLC